MKSAVGAALVSVALLAPAALAQSPSNSLNLRQLTRPQVIAKLGQPSSVGDGWSVDKGALIYFTVKGRPLHSDDTVALWYPGDFPLQKGKMPPVGKATCLPASSDGCSGSPAPAKKASIPGLQASEKKP